MALFGLAGSFREGLLLKVERTLRGSRRSSDSDPMLTSVDSHRTPYGIGSAAPQAPDDHLRVAPVFSLCSASDGQRRRRMAMASRAWSNASKKGAQPSLVSARFHRKDKDLAGINTIWIPNLVLVRSVNDGVSHARAVGDTADAPEAVATGYDRGRDIGHDHGGR